MIGMPLLRSLEQDSISNQPSNLHITVLDRKGMTITFNLGKNSNSMLQTLHIGLFVMSDMQHSQSSYTSATSVWSLVYVLPYHVLI